MRWPSIAGCDEDAGTAHGDNGLADAQRFADPLDLRGTQRGGRSQRQLIKPAHRHLIDRPGCAQFFRGNVLLITDVDISLVLNKKGFVVASLVQDSYWVGLMDYTSSIAIACHSGGRHKASSSAILRPSLIHVTEPAQCHFETLFTQLQPNGKSDARINIDSSGGQHKKCNVTNKKSKLERKPRASVLKPND
ncbi:MAG: hypothetical protein ACLQFF_09210 [Steroidobacteraceae bacterium]